MEENLPEVTPITKQKYQSQSTGITHHILIIQWGGLGGELPALHVK